MRRWIFAAGLVALVGSDAAAEEWALRLEAGSEYDTNIHRLEVADGDPEPDEGPLLRMGARYQLASAGAGGRLRFEGYGGTKLFVTGPGQSESVLIAAANAGYTRALPGRRAASALRPRADPGEDLAGPGIDRLMSWEIDGCGRERSTFTFTERVHPGP